MNISQEQVEFLRKQHLQIGMPCYGGMMYSDTAMSLIKFMMYAQKIGLNVSISHINNESLITRARASISAQFLENSAATHLLWIDADIGFEPEYIFQLLLHDKDIIGGLYPKKTLPPDYVVNANPDATDENGHIKVVDGLIEVSRLGTGFMMIKRIVFDKLIAAFPQTKFTNNIGLDKKFDPFMYSLFDCAISPDTMEYMSEDWLFSCRWRSLGGKIFVDPQIRLNHNGTFCFPGDPTHLYRSMGLDAATNPSLNPKISVRPDETKNDECMLALKPDYEGLKKWETEQAIKKNIESLPKIESDVK